MASALPNIPTVKTGSRVVPRSSGKGHGRDSFAGTCSISGGGKVRNPKKRRISLAKKLLKYAFIATYEQEFSIQRKCVMSGVSRSGYHAWRRACRVCANKSMVHSWQKST